MSGLSKLSTRRKPTPAKVKPAAIANASAKRYPTLDALLSDVDSALPPAQRARFEARKAWARSALARIKTFEEWRSTATPVLIREIVKVFGSIEASYARLVRELESEAVTPTPTEVHRYPDGSWKGLW